MSWLPDILQHVFAFQVSVVTPYTLAIILLPAVFSYYIMAILVQLPRTALYRAAFLPVVLWLAFRANMSLDFSWNNPAYNYLNQGLALGMFTIAMRSMTWVSAERPYIRQPIRRWGNVAINDRSGNPPAERGVSVPLAMWNACDLIVNLRGLGWSGPPQIKVPTPYFQVESRLTFILLSACRAIILTLMFDVMQRTVQWYGSDTFGTPKGGTLIDSSLPPLERYMKSSVITLIIGLAAYAIIEVVYQIHAILFTILFSQYPSQWPPLFDSPWLSTSLASFWAQRWHQLFREPFVAVGSKPLEKYFGRVGMVMGAFAVSGALHDVGVRGMGQGGNTLFVTGFFLMHGVGVVIEDTWKRVTGRRVGGFIGWLWVLSWHILWGHFLTDTWARKGLMGSEFFPEDYRPTKLVLNWISQSYKLL